MEEGIKYDEKKNRLDLIPFDALEEIGLVFSYGSLKYTDRNWEGGMNWSRLFGAILRHLIAFWRGENFDPETNLSHLAHAGCGILMLLATFRRQIGKDNRVEKESYDHQKSISISEYEKLKNYIMTLIEEKKNKKTPL